jgi:hypothetical protein
LLCARLEVPKLLFRRAFRGGFLQIRDRRDETREKTDDRKKMRSREKQPRERRRQDGD